MVQVHSILAGQSVALLRRLQREYPQVRFSLIGDSAFESCCTDEVAAKHIGTEVLVHIGYACGCKGSLETIFIQEKQALDAAALQKCLASLPTPIHVTCKSDRVGFCVYALPGLTTAY